MPGDWLWVEILCLMLCAGFFIVGVQASIPLFWWLAGLFAWGAVSIKYFRTKGQRDSRW